MSNGSDNNFYFDNNSLQHGEKEKLQGTNDTLQIQPLIT
jgi:hypothetical protein